ncbi:MAG: FmdB family zinc ribbon protein [Candidatus Aminicenantales bacterium]
MPIYEYRCSQCHSTIEVLQKAKDKPPQKCPKCGGSLVKLFSSSAIQFKGNGWYITDYAKKNSPSPGGKPAEKPDTKPDAAKEKKDPPKPTPSSSD